MAELIRIHTTAGSEKEAQQISQAVLETKLAACVQIHGPVRSHYWWNGKIEQSNEWVCTIKTVAANFSHVRDVICTAHSYDEPQIVATPVTHASDGYHNWVTSSVKHS